VSALVTPSILSLTGMFASVRVFCATNQIPAEDLKALMKRSYGTFTDKQVVPTKTVGDMEIMELFHGPTYAFKDVALQVM
jgi:threonine synthase